MLVLVINRLAHGCSQQKLKSKYVSLDICNVCILLRSEYSRNFFKWRISWMNFVKAFSSNICMIYVVCHLHNCILFIFDLFVTLVKKLFWFFNFEVCAPTFASCILIHHLWRKIVAKTTFCHKHHLILSPRQPQTEPLTTVNNFSSYLWGLMTPYGVKDLGQMIRNAVCEFITRNNVDLLSATCGANLCENEIQ